MLVNDICMLANKSPLTLNKFLIINWSRGLWFQMGWSLSNEYCIFNCFSSLAAYFKKIITDLLIRFYIFLYLN